MIRKLTTATALALLALATPAGATHVQCGATITQDTTLDSDIICLEGQTDGLYIGANDVTLNLGGYTIRAAATGGDYGVTNAPEVTEAKVIAWGDGLHKTPKAPT